MVSRWALVSDGCRGICRCPGGRDCWRGDMNDSSINLLVKTAAVRTGAGPFGYSTHGLRAGFVTYTYFDGPVRPIDFPSARDRSRASLASLRVYKTRGKERRCLASRLTGALVVECPC